MYTYTQIETHIAELNKLCATMDIVYKVVRVAQNTIELTRIRNGYSEFILDGTELTILIYIKGIFAGLSLATEYLKK